MTPDPKVRIIAHALREALQSMLAGKIVYWHSDMAGGCGIASVALVRLLRRRKIQAEFVAGRFGGEPHCWVEFPDGAILDVTATQFGEEYPPVYFGRNPLYVPEVRGPRAASGITRRPDWRRQIRHATAAAAWRIREDLKGLGPTRTFAADDQSTT